MKSIDELKIIIAIGFQVQFGFECNWMQMGDESGRLESQLKMSRPVTIQQASATNKQLITVTSNEHPWTSAAASVPGSGC